MVKQTHNFVVSIRFLELFDNLLRPVWAIIVNHDDLVLIAPDGELIIKVIQ